MKKNKQPVWQFIQSPESEAYFLAMNAKRARRAARWAANKAVLKEIPGVMGVGIAAAVAAFLLFLLGNSIAMSFADLFLKKSLNRSGSIATKHWVENQLAGAVRPVHHYEYRYIMKTNYVELPDISEQYIRFNTNQAVTNIMWSTNRNIIWLKNSTHGAHYYE